MFLFFGKDGQENEFDDILERKSLSRLRKHRLKKVKKLFFFPKGLVHDFGQKFKLFRSSYLRQSRARKCV